MPSSEEPIQPSFDQILQAASLPEPGPEYYAARRRIWLTPTQVLPPPASASLSRQRIENLFNQSNGNSIVYSHEAWRNGLEKVWKGLSSGVRLKYKLPLNIVVKIIHAAWVRDKTWPVGMHAPESDEEQPHEASPIFDTISASSSLQPTPLSTSTNSDVMEIMAPPGIDRFS